MKFDAYAARGDMTRILKATMSGSVTSGLLRQIACLGSHGVRVDEDASNFALGFVDSMAPQDPAEALLVAQMAAIHQAAMMLARRLNHVDTIPQQDAAERALNKLARTYAAQMEALKRYRAKVQQTVRVEHVTVESGGQAVVGNVVQGGGPMKKPDVSPMHSAPRCMARSKRSGLPCRNPAVRGWTVCRMHGARGGSKPADAHPRFRHGGRSREAETLRSRINALLRESRAINLDLLDD